MDDDWFFDYDDADFEDGELGDDEWSDDACAHCGPHCKHWMGDDLCALQLDALADEGQEYEDLHTAANIPCPVCGAVLNQYEVLTDTLWTWPGGWYNPMIALDVYAVYDCPKGELHHSDDGRFHVWIGEGEFRTEKLIYLLEYRERQSC